MDKIKSFISNIKEQQVAMQEIQNIFRMVNIVSKFVFEGITVQVVEDPTYLKAYGFKIAACSIPMIGQINIHVDEIFKSLDQDVKDAIIFHEIAHYINKDFKCNIYISLIKRSAQMIFNKCDIKELKADAYAASRVGTETMIKTLRLMMDLFSDNKSMVKELNCRVNALDDIIYK